MLVFASLVGLVAAAVPMAAAHEGNNHGTLKVHDDEPVDPAQRNQPHVSCDFWIESFNMADDSGTLEFWAIPPTENPPVLVLEDTWTGTEEEGGGYHFLAGPYQLEPGHYKVEAYLDQGHPGSKEHKAKSKVFWVNECPEEEREAPPCPPGVTATARADGEIHLEWGAIVDADNYRIYRAVSGEDFEPLAQVDGSTLEYTDTDTTVGVTYQYFVTAVVNGVESEDCEVIEATAIPFFPGVALAALAVLGGVGALVWARRK